jgi:hypothetical protein
MSFLCGHTSFEGVNHKFISKEVLLVLSCASELCNLLQILAIPLPRIYNNRLLSKWHMSSLNHRRAIAEACYPHPFLSLFCLANRVD